MTVKPRDGAVDVVGTQQRQVVFGSHVRHDRGVVGRGHGQSHDRALEGQVPHGAGDHRKVGAARVLGGHPNAFGTDHQRGLPTRFDGGLAGAGFQGAAEHLDLDVVAVDAAGLAAGPEIGLADETGDEDRGRPVVDVGRGADLLHVARVHDRDAVTHRERFLLVMGDVDEGDADLALDALQLELHGMAQLQVQRTERFIEQQGAGVVHQRPGQRDPLLLATGKLAGLALGEIGEPDYLDDLVDPTFCLAPAFGLVQLPAARAVGDVVPHGHVREQRIVLEHRVDVAFVRGDLRHVDPFEPDLTGGGRLETGDHAQRGRLAASRGAQHGEELTGGDGEIGVGHRDVVVEAFDHVVDLDDGVALAHGGPAGCRVRGGGVCTGQDWPPQHRGR